ncbi:hypothetical protein N7462_005064 [Penicillium macrosclerotiorum]|uniref:uncharacterized protein n=1 Tax=Penicillium macrosclerotiorum TaxID=303699 RepID=UPI00254793D4|nr:uncharacterized protein N7462_005064 [Penicillium macrosclerotiorum]KAJ5690672.1 hypothetical protein N7462_005064 [Penicillium macrosclerotiorum]
MSPRRGSGSSSYGYYYGYDNPWAEEIQFSMDSLLSKSLFIAGFAFDVLTVLALICFLVWACIVRNHRGQMRGVVITIITWLLAVICAVIYEIFYLAEATITQYYVIDLMLNEFFFLLGSCLLFFVYYHLINGMLDRLTDSGKPYAAVAVIHWVVIGLVSLISLATWAMYVAYQVQYVNNGYTGALRQSYPKLESARAIIYWLLSLEILAWVIFVTVKAGSHRFTSRLPVIALTVSSLFWMALNMMYAIVFIRYTLEDTVRTTPKYLSTVESVCQFFFIVAIFTGILFCCMNWRKVDDRQDKPSLPAQHPYQTYQTYQQQYPAQPQQPLYQHPYQQPYQPPYQQPYQQQHIYPHPQQQPQAKA